MLLALLINQSSSLKGYTSFLIKGFNNKGQILLNADKGHLAHHFLKTPEYFY
jgi:hypothetical protein